MAQKTRTELNIANASLFTANGAKAITGPLEKAFNEDVNDSVALLIDDNDFTGVNNHTKEVRWHKGTDLVAATALALGVTGNFHHVTGSTEIETLSTKQHGTRMLLYFEGTPNLKNSANLILGGADILVSAGSTAEFISEGGGVWRLIKQLPESGEYTPTLTDGGQFSGSTLEKAYFQRNGNLAVVQVNLNCDLSSGPSGTIDISLPIPTTATLDATNTFGNINWFNLNAPVPDQIRILGNGTTVQFNVASSVAVPFNRLYLSFVYPLS